jgi:CheY-like chemotaxis protein
MTISKSDMAPRQPKSRGALRVLVVDDDPFEVEVIGALLGKLGVWDITKTVGGAAALRVLEKRPTSIDLMLTDLHMPGMDGFEFMASAAKLGFDGALIIVSGQNEEVVHSASLVAQLRRIKLLGTLKKPVTKEALGRLVPL